MVLNRVYLESVKGANTHATSSLVTGQSVDLFISVGADFILSLSADEKIKRLSNIFWNVDYSELWL